MAAEIVPIELGLTSGNVVTLWAPRWREDGEDWEAFLGHGDNLYVFPDTAQLAAFVRSSDEHDLIDHPEWEDIPEAIVDELNPSDDHRFDLVGIPELVAGPPDIWTLAELADTVAIVRSLGDVCDLEPVAEFIGAAEGFDLLSLGESAFAGRTGEKLWTGIGKAVVEHWGGVLDAIEAIVITPEVDADALATAEAEVAAVAAILAGPAEPDEDTQPRGEELQFWDNIGIDCVEITVGGRTGYTLRCYLGDKPVFLSVGGRPQVFSRTKDLLTYLADGTANNSLTGLEAFTQIREGAEAGEVYIVAGPENTYRLDGLDAELIEGPETVNPRRLALAIELLGDAAIARDDDETTEALSSAAPLGWLIQTALNPDPSRLAPSPPFDDEVDAWHVLIENFTGSLDWDPQDEDKN